MQWHSLEYTSSFGERFDEGEEETICTVDDCDYKKKMDGKKQTPINQHVDPMFQRQGKSITHAVTNLGEDRRVRSGIYGLEALWKDRTVPIPGNKPFYDVLVDGACTHFLWEEQ